jgi:hypothetical protein
MVEGGQTGPQLVLGLVQNVLPELPMLRRTLQREKFA